MLLCMLWAASANALNVRIIGDRLSLHADQVPLQDILRKRADLGINLRIDPQLNPLTTASFDDRDIQKGVASILKSYNHILSWKMLEEPSGSITRLAEIQIFKPRKKRADEILNPIIPIRIFDDNGYTSNFNIMHAKSKDILNASAESKKKQ